MAELSIYNTLGSSKYTQVLVEELQSQGHSLYARTYRRELDSRLDLDGNIVDILRQSDVFLSVYSEADLQSKFAKYELSFVSTYAQERGTPLIIPICLGNFDIPNDLIQYHWLRDSEIDPKKTAISITHIINNYFSRKQAKQDKRREVLKQMEKSASNFVSVALEDLRKREKGYKFYANFWYGVSFVVLLLTVLFGILRIYHTDYSHITGLAMLQTCISSVIVLALMIAVAKYSFTLGKSYMVESLRNADRCHAISFGEFYLKAFGESSSNAEIMEAFKEWNIDKGSCFINQKSEDFDPKLIQVFTAMAKVLSDKKGIC